MFLHFCCCGKIENQVLYIERIVEDSAGLFAKQETTNMALDEFL